MGSDPPSRPDPPEPGGGGDSFRHDTARGGGSRVASSPPRLQKELLVQSPRSFPLSTSTSSSSSTSTSTTSTTTSSRSSSRSFLRTFYARAPEELEVSPGRSEPQAAMNNGSNRSIDPSCTDRPPLAMEIILKLDLFGIILYSILTFMAAVAMLVFFEECVYIYRKVPGNKKSVLIWVNGAAPTICALSCLGMWVPRATMFTDMFSACYFAIVVFKFLIMMVEEVGGDEAFLRRSGKHKLKISTGPCCCCCLCLPHVDITRRSLFLLKLGSFQFALLKIVFTIISIVLWTNGSFNLTDMSITGAAIWINPFVAILTIIALWPVSITFMHLRTTLRTLKIIPKYAMYQLVLILTQLQAAIINILAMNGTIACTPPFSSIARGYMMSQQLLILEMFIITLVTRLLYRRQYSPLPSEEHDALDENAKMAALSDSS